MKKVFALLAITMATTSYAQQVTNDRVVNSYPDTKTMIVTRKSLGIGTPAPMVTVDTEPAIKVDDDYYHSPQDMPFYPTAAVIWPRVVELECEVIKGNTICEGYRWQPKYGRGEYLFVVPKMKVKPVVPPPVVIYKEVPVKPNRE